MGGDAAFRVVLRVGAGLPIVAVGEHAARPRAVGVAERVAAKRTKRRFFEKAGGAADAHRTQALALGHAGAVAVVADAVGGSLGGQRGSVKLLGSCAGSLPLLPQALTVSSMETINPVKRRDTWMIISYLLKIVSRTRGFDRSDCAVAGGPVAARELAEDDTTDLASTTPRLPGLTQDGVAVGTPLYMSPEQHLGEAVDGRSDQFSFCVALYEALYGQLPFVGKNVSALRYNVVKGKVLPRPPASSVPAPVHAALLRGLAPTPDKRFPSMRELLNALSFDEARDPAAAPGERRRVTVGLIAFAVLSTLLQRSLRWFAVDPVTSTLEVAVAFFVCLGLLAFRVRRVLLNNAFHRGMIVTSLVLSGQIVGLRLVGRILRLPVSQVLTIDLVALTAMSCMLSAMVLPSLWPVVPVAAAITLLAAWQQPYAPTIAEVLFPGMIFAAVILWNRAARKPAVVEGGRSL